MNRFAKTTLFLCSIAVIVITGIIGYRIHLGSSTNKSVPSATQAITCNDWNLINSPSPGNDSNILYAITAISVQNIWAAGMTKTTHGQQALIEHWNGSSWQTVTVPITGSSDDSLHGIAAISANNIWAAGTTYDSSAKMYRALIEHWDGTKWSLNRSANAPLLNINLYAIAANSSRDIWAVGLSFSNNQNQARQTQVEHWNGFQWNLVKSVNEGDGDNVFSAVIAISTNDVWAVGSNSSRELIEHWDGKAWNAVSDPALEGVSTASLNAVEAVSKNDIWAVGQMNPLAGGDVALVEHWNGRTWSSVQIGNPEAKLDWLNGLSVVSANNIWAVGEFKDYNTRLLRTFTLHWDGKQWGLSQWPWLYGQANGGDDFEINAVAAIDIHHVWSVGSATNITQNPPIDDPNHGQTRTFTLFRC